MLLLAILTSCNSSCRKHLNKKEFNGQELSRYLTVASSRTFTTDRNKTVGWNDTLSIYVDNKGRAIMVNDIPISQNKLDSEHISVTPLKEKYEYEYDSDGRLTSAIVPASRDIPKFKFIWENDLVTDVIVTGDYHGNTQHNHIVYDMTVNSPRSGIALFMDLFDTNKLMAKYLTGEIGGYVPSHPIAAIYIYNDVYKNDTLTFTYIVDKKNRLSAYSAKSHTIDVNRHFDYPN